MSKKRNMDDFDLDYKTNNYITRKIREAKHKNKKKNRGKNRQGNRKGEYGQNEYSGD